MASWWKERNRRALRKRPTPESWQRWLDSLWFFPHLTAEERGRILETCKILVAEKNWEGCGGLGLEDEHRVVIAAQIAWLVLGFDEIYFDHVQSILVYPNAYEAHGRESAGGGIVLEGPSARQGEAWYRGPVVLSWDDAHRGGLGRNHGHNLVLHEFAHQLDMLNGRATDGVPPFDDDHQAQRWIEVTTREFESLVARSDAGHKTFLDPYGATNRSEFFAVATEAFFQLPTRFYQHHAEMYQVFANFYRQDPLKRESL